MSESSKRIWIIFGFWVLGPLMIIGLLAGLSQPMEGLRLGYQSDSWQAVEGELTDKRTISRRRSGGSGSRTRHQLIEYQYTVDGRRYTHDTVYPYDPARIRRFRHHFLPVSVGESIRVYVDVENPHRATLIQGVHRWTWIEIVILAFLLMGASGLWYLSWIHWRRLKSK